MFVHEIVPFSVRGLVGVYGTVEPFTGAPPWPGEPRLFALTGQAVRKLPAKLQ